MSKLYNLPCIFIMHYACNYLSVIRKYISKKNDRRYQKTFFCLLYFPCHMLRNNITIQCNWCGQKVNEIVFYNLFRIAYPPMQKKIRSLVVSLTYLTQPLFSFIVMDHKFQLPRTKDYEFTIISIKVCFGFCLIFILNIGWFLLNLENLQYLCKPMRIFEITRKTEPGIILAKPVDHGYVHCKYS